MAARKKVTKKATVKKASPVRRAPSRKAAHEQLFDDHPNLRILLFLFAAVAVTFFIFASNFQG